MKATELIEQLQKLIKEHGDYIVAVYDHVDGNDWEASEVYTEKNKSFGWSMNPETKKYDIHEVYDSFVIK